MRQFPSLYSVFCVPEFVSPLRLRVSLALFRYSLRRLLCRVSGHKRPTVQAPGVGQGLFTLCARCGWSGHDWTGPRGQYVPPYPFAVLASTHVLVAKGHHVIGDLPTARLGLKWYFGTVDAPDEFSAAKLFARQRQLPPSRVLVTNSHYWSPGYVFEAEGNGVDVTVRPPDPRSWKGTGRDVVRPGHQVVGGVCALCGCSETALRCFGWECSERYPTLERAFGPNVTSSGHNLVGGVCSRCGCSETAIRYFKWKCHKRSAST